ncbi:hypothetical protein BT69DRAFT_521045 [Atractiella rhizophila]|nr:hypothetical protein BT69DRAFT_521045 [Atractiella rhizophila]
MDRILLIPDDALRRLIIKWRVGRFGFNHPCSCGLPSSRGHVSCLISSLGFFSSANSPFMDLSFFSKVPLPSIPNSSLLDAIIGHRNSAFSSIAYQTLLVWSDFLHR